MGVDGASNYTTVAQNAANQRITKMNGIRTLADVSKLYARSSVSVFGGMNLTAAQQTQAYRAYSQQLLSGYYDANQDGTVSVDEFGNREYRTNNMMSQFESALATMNGTPLTDAEKAKNDRIARNSAQLFAENLDFNGNGQIDAEELAFFNSTADGIDGKKDGVISSKAEAAMFGAVTGSNADDPEINRVVNLYLSGEELSDADMQILKGSQAKIRAAMKKAAGL